VLLKHSNNLVGYEGLVLTLIDVLSGQKEIKICTHYELNSQKIDYFPASNLDLEKCLPVYETLQG
jgi:adenylosuccinate synthase